MWAIMHPHYLNIRIARHLKVLAVLVLVASAIWIGDRLIAGQIGIEALCASKVATAGFGDVPMLGGGYCRPNWSSTIGVFLTTVVLLFVAGAIAYFIFYFVPVSLHRGLRDLQRQETYE